MGFVGRGLINKMDICILNSGFGSRLKKYTTKMPKGLVPLNDNDSILSKQIDIFRLLDDFNYVITTGYLDGMIQEYIKNRYPKLDVNYLFNEKYESTNYITSLHLLDADYKDSIILLHGDLVFEKSVASDVVNSNKSVVIIDSSLPLPEKDFKAKVVDGKVVAIGVDLFGDNCFACQPFYHLKKKDWNIWQKEITHFCDEGITDVYGENALNAISDKIDLFPFDVKGRLCKEIDNEEDLTSVRNILESLNEQ